LQPAYQRTNSIEGSSLPNASYFVDKRTQFSRQTSVTKMPCMQRYKCNVEMVFSGQMNNIIESRFIRSTDCIHVALANLLVEIIILRDGVLSLPTWFSREVIHGVTVA